MAKIAYTEITAIFIITLMIFIGCSMVTNIFVPMYQVFFLRELRDIRAFEPTTILRFDFVTPLIPLSILGGYHAIVNYSWSFTHNVKREEP